MKKNEPKQDRNKEKVEESSFHSVEKVSFVVIDFFRHVRKPQFAANNTSHWLLSERYATVSFIFLASVLPSRMIIAPPPLSVLVSAGLRMWTIFGPGLQGSSFSRLPRGMPQESPSPL